MIIRVGRHLGGGGAVVRMLCGMIKLVRVAKGKEDSLYILHFWEDRKVGIL